MENLSLEEERASFESALLVIDRGAARAVMAAASERWGPLRAAELLVTPVLERIGEAWSAGALALAQLYMAGRICEDLMEEILPVFAPGRLAAPRIAVAVLEDHHALGKRLLAAFLHAGGFDVLDYGHGLSVESLSARCRLDEVHILLVSTLMLPAALRVRTLMAALQEDADSQGGRRPWVIVGGAPYLFDDTLWLEVGADSLGESAGQSVALVHEAMASMAGRQAG